MCSLRGLLFTWKNNAQSWPSLKLWNRNISFWKICKTDSQRSPFVWNRSLSFRNYWWRWTSAHVTSRGVCMGWWGLEWAGGTGKPFQQPAEHCWQELFSIHNAYERRLRNVNLFLCSQEPKQKVWNNPVRCSRARTMCVASAHLGLTLIHSQPYRIPESLAFLIALTNYPF